MADEIEKGFGIKEIVIGVDEMSLTDYALQLAEALEEAPRDESNLIHLTDELATEIANHLRMKTSEVGLQEERIRYGLRQLSDHEGLVTMGSLRGKLHMKLLKSLR